MGKTASPTQNLMKRGEVWYARAFVPLRLQAAVRKKEVWRSLGTKDKKAAERKLHHVLAETNASFDAVEKQLNAEADEATFLASERGRAALEQLNARLNSMHLPSFGSPINIPEGADYAQRAFIEEALRLIQPDTGPQSRAEAIEICDNALAELARERAHGVQLAIGSDQDGEPIWCVPVRHLDAVERFINEQFDADEAKLRAIRDQLLAQQDTTVTKASKQARPGADLGSLQALQALWIRTRDPAAKTQTESRTALTRFERVNGPIPFRDVTPEHLRRFKADILGDAKIASATKKKQWSMLSILFGIARDDGLLAANPFDSVKLGKLKDDAEAREVLTKEDLAKLFATLEGEEWWLVRLGLYTGARLGELCQLRKGDLTAEGGITYLHITDDPEAGKTVKTRNSVRRVPVHQQLMKDGFADWATSRPGDQLFSFTSAVASKRLLRRFKAAGLSDGKVVHSLRHTFIGAARRVMEEDYRERLTGHKSQRVSRTYGDYSELKQKIDLVDFELT
ncbi:site-specific integrase [Teichococcus vastitatis]|uniref:Tyrosine-type recombinase/integrase n=1 Tax=Teichococcus vastitatis TaxID=2307076 RepID=A0ABS9W2G4_9PROT|nr:site-specific integrase [Pseudoroseomonas vastitatis]MCI0752754.1 tyrosine-type recombinase/integrase [Pseudoroseomonas vastitatis]